MSWDAAVEGAHPRGGVSARVDLHLGAHPSELPVVAAARRRRARGHFEFGPARSDLFSARVTRVALKVSASGGLSINLWPMAGSGSAPCLDPGVHRRAPLLLLSLHWHTTHSQPGADSSTGRRCRPTGK